MTNNSKAIFDKLTEYADSHVEDTLQAVYAANDGLMKVHEFIGTVQDRVDDVFQGAIDGVWKVSEFLDRYADGIVAKTTGKEPVKMYGLDDTLKEADRRDKIAALIEFYGIRSDSNVATELNNLNDATIDGAYDALKKFKK